MKVTRSILTTLKCVCVCVLVGARMPVRLLYMSVWVWRAIQLLFHKELNHFCI